MTHQRPLRPVRLITALLLATALALGLVACGSDSEDVGTTGTSAADTTDTTAAASGMVSDEGGLTIANPWARTSPDDTTYGAVYLELTSVDGDSLVNASVSADVAGSVEMHETVAVDSAETTVGSDTTEATTGGSDTTVGGMGEMTMQPVDAIELPAGESVTLEPGGYHIMLIDLVAPLETGQEIEVTLTFENAGERTITVPVQDDAP